MKCSLYEEILHISGVVIGDSYRNNEYLDADEHCAELGKRAARSMGQVISECGSEELKQLAARDKEIEKELEETVDEIYYSRKLLLLGLLSNSSTV